MCETIRTICSLIKHVLSIILSFTHDTNDRKKLLTHNGFIVLIGVWVDTDDHANFALTIKVVLEEMSETRISVGDHLQ